MTKQKIKDTLVSSASILVIILVALVAFLLQNRTEYWVSHSDNVKIHVMEIYTLVQGAESDLRGYLITDDTSYMEPLGSVRAQLRVRTRSLAGMISDNLEQVQTMSRYGAYAEARMNVLEKIYSLYRVGKKEKALEIVNSDVGENMMKEVEGLKDRMIAEENRLLYERQYANIILQRISLILLTLATIFAGYSLHRLYKRVSPLINELNVSNTNLRSTIDEKNKEIERRKEAEEHNAELIKMLTAKNEELNHFAYIASHDLQEPLRTVNNFIEVFKEDYGSKLDKDADQYFDFITGATSRMKALIEGLLSYSRLGKSRGAEKVDLNELMHGVKENLHAAIVAKKASVEWEPLPTLACMKTETTQLFQNLVNNALKYSLPAVAPLVRIGVEEKAQEWEFCVSDNGIGIPKEQQGRIFNMFSRLHGDGEYQGQGIGLAFCKKIAELHGGRIWVSSVPGQGSSFYFTVSKNIKDETEA